MRLDKFLKVSRIIKRRTVAKEYVDKGFVLLNDKVAKASSIVNVNDALTICLKGETHRYRILNIFEYATEEKARTMFEEIKWLKFHSINQKYIC